MNQTINPYLIITALWVCIGFGTLSAFWKRDATAVQHRQASERINLALRRTTHLLLTLAKDSTSKIAPVKQSDDNITPTHETEKIAETPLIDTHLIHVGKTVFDTRKQTLLMDGIEQKLTFQEAQLLQLFCDNRNELLERGFILKTVWGDDGVLITRRVDVFVSRLRKLLKADETLKIVNVHNRGYRFEVLDT